MKPPFPTRYLVAAGAWLATSAITFSLGRLGSTPAELPAQPGRSAALTHSIGSGSAASSAGQSESAAGFQPSRAMAGQETVESVTGGKPVDEWLKTLLSQDDEILRMEGFMRLLGTLKSPDDLRAALEAVNAIGGRNRWRGGVGMREASMLLQKWTQLDPKGAASYAGSAKNNDEKWMATSVVLSTWARINPEEAVAYAQANNQPANPEDGNWGMAAVISQLAKSDIDRALQVAGTQELSRARGRMMDTVLSELLSQRGPDSARNTILSLAPGTFRDNMTAQLAGRLADSDGPGTAQWVMNALPAGDVRNRALAEVVNQWANDDPTAAGNYLAKFPASPDTDPARERYAFDVFRRDPEGALAWAGTISTPEQRTKAVENLVRSWMRRDRNAAQTWVASAQLPNDVKARLIQN